MDRRTLLRISSVALLPQLAVAQPRAGRIVVPFPAGGATDIVARLLADPLARELAHPIVVDNRAGAGGSLGMAEVARAAPDGLTLGIATVSTHGVNPVVYRQLPYDPLTDFTPIAELVRAPGVMVVHPGVPARTFPDFLAHLKAHPGKLSYGSPGHGSTGHMAGEIFKASTHTFIVHIPYRGAAAMLTDLIGGRIQVASDQLASALPHIRAGRLRPLAVSWHTRLAQLPDVPTFAELKLPANNEPSWFGLVAPAGLPPEKVRTLHAAARRSLAVSEVKARIEQLGLFAADSSPEEFGRRIRGEIERMQRVARLAKLVLDAP
ncbi:MAG TPA: tripartite tricarboxylate transporter substrate binding protein BugE [Albitalea sp.]